MEGVTYSAGYTQGCSLTLMHIRSSKKNLNDKLHYHSKDSEYYYVLHGKLEILIDGKKVIIKKGECLETEPNEKHRVLKIPEGTEYIVARTNLIPGEKILVN